MLVQIKSFAVTPLSVVGGATANGTVTIAEAAGPSGVTVRFQSSNTAIATVPANVVVQPGSTSAIFVVQTFPISVNPNVVTDAPTADISAQAGTLPAMSVKLTVRPPALVCCLSIPPPCPAEQPRQDKSP
ncbi:MAG TPA: hypothetical protein VER58_10955 [Thermoanaerobaculia bacterium]|nr:hypothetical protein [Thermoanaerobaculia bacterium]